MTALEFVEVLDLDELDGAAGPDSLNAGQNCRITPAIDDPAVHAAVWDLAERRPDLSASQVMTVRQWRGLVVTVSVAAAFTAWFPRLAAGMWLVSAGAVFAVFVGFKMVVGLVGAFAPAPTYRELSDDELPVYTVLVPAFREPEVIRLVTENVTSIDYPQHLLDVILCLEADDSATLDVIAEMELPACVRVLETPPMLPRTKPKACNLALAYARGELLTIFDAEDRPEPDQLRKAVAAFRDGSDDVAVYQGALNYFNAHENALASWFTVEYSAWFDTMLVGLDRLRLPIPLGGTSNHFRTDRLRQLGGWDPFNVTEDADLGIRAAAEGWSVGVLASTTFEEANVEVGNWIRQRSRWIKGYMQTALVHARHPARLVRRVGVKNAAGFAVLIGGTPLAFLVAPVLWLTTLVSLFRPSVLDGVLPAWARQVALLEMVVGNLMMVATAVIAVVKRRQWKLTLWGLAMPIYWTLHSVASYKAIAQLVTRPFHWEKTNHGLSKHISSTAA